MPSFFCFCNVAKGALRDRADVISHHQSAAPPKGWPRSSAGSIEALPRGLLLKPLGATSGPHPLGIALVLPFVAALIPAPLVSLRKRPRAELPRQYRLRITLGSA